MTKVSKEFSEILDEEVPRIERLPFSVVQARQLASSISITT